MTWIPLEPVDEPLKVYVISLWEDRRDAEKYETESFAAVTHILEPFLVLPPVVKHGTIAEAITTTLAMTSLPDGSENRNQILASHGGTHMFARFLEMTIKLDKKAELIKKVKEEILPVLSLAREGGHGEVHEGALPEGQSNCGTVSSPYPSS